MKFQTDRAILSDLPNNLFLLFLNKQKNFFTTLRVFIYQVIALNQQNIGRYTNILNM